LEQFFFDFYFHCCVCCCENKFLASLYLTINYLTEQLKL